MFILPKKIKLQHYYFSSTFLNKCFFKCLHLLKSSDLLFNIFPTLIKLIIDNFSGKHNLQKLIGTPIHFCGKCPFNRKTDIITFQLPDVFCYFCAIFVLLIFKISNVISVAFFKGGVS